MSLIDTSNIVSSITLDNAHVPYKVASGVYTPTKDTQTFTVSGLGFKPVDFYLMNSTAYMENLYSFYLFVGTLETVDRDYSGRAVYNNGSIKTFGHISTFSKYFIANNDGFTVSLPSASKLAAGCSYQWVVRGTYSTNPILTSFTYDKNNVSLGVYTGTYKAESETKTVTIDGFDFTPREVYFFSPYNKLNDLGIKAFGADFKKITTEQGYGLCTVMTNTEGAGIVNAFDSSQDIIFTRNLGSLKIDFSAISDDASANYYFNPNDTYHYIIIY